jgi:hypothetical protein
MQALKRSFCIDRFKAGFLFNLYRLHQQLKAFSVKLNLSDPGAQLPAIIFALSGFISVWEAS